MVLPDTPQTPDQTETPPVPSELGKIGDLEGVQEIITHLKKGEWAPMVGAIFTLYKELFGTPEEKAEIARARTENKLRTLRTDVEIERESKDEPAQDGKKEQSSEHDEVVPYKPGTKEPHLSPKNTFRPQVEQIYAQNETFFTLQNLSKYFGRNYEKFIVREDPVTHEQPITFFGKPISGGVNLMMIPFLRIAERNIMDLDLNYAPRQKEIEGFQNRNMCVRTDPSNPNSRTISDSIPSFHKYGLAIDIDKPENWPENGRGNIPDEVVLAMARAGFNIGMMGDQTARHYLINDSMHFQMRFPPDSPAGQKIVEASPIGRRYWKAISPMLEGLKLTS
ncbi:MAG: M15 family metallopeptidase [Patescibacteria group bacterium]